MESNYTKILNTKIRSNTKTKAHVINAKDVTKVHTIITKKKIHENLEYLLHVNP